MLVSTAEQDAIRVAFTTGDDIIVTALVGQERIFEELPFGSMV